MKYGVVLFSELQKKRPNFTSWHPRDHLPGVRLAELREEKEKLLQRIRRLEERIQATEEQIRAAEAEEEDLVRRLRK